LVLSQQLFTGGFLTHTYTRAGILSDATRLRFERQKREIINDVTKSYRQALNAQLSTLIVEKTTEAKKERLRVLRELETEGYVGKEEVLQQETDILFTELEWQKAKNRAEIALTRLKNLTQYKGKDSLHLKGNPVNATLTASLDDVEESAAHNREDLKASLAKVSAADEEVVIAKSGFYPQVSLEGQYIQQKDTNITRPQVWMIQAQVEWSLFEWGKTTSEVRLKVARRQRAQYEREELEKAVLLEAEHAWRSLKEREKTVAAHKKRVTTEEYRLNVTADRYAEGKLKLAEVIEMEAQFIKAYNEYLIAINDLDVDLANLEAATALPMEQWLRTEEIYKPGFDALEKKLKELPAKKKEAKPEYIPVKTEKTGAGLGSSSAKPVDQTDKTNHAAAVNDSAIVPPAHIVVQVGSFKARKDAYRQMKDFSRKIRNRKIAIYPNGKFYKVRIAGFRSKDEAEDTMKNAGITNYVVLRKSNGR